jgi:hypothetical protein
VLTTGGAHEDLGLGNAARSAILKVMRAVPAPWPTSTASRGCSGGVVGDSAVADEAPVRRRDGVELAELWQTLRRQVEERPAEVTVVARVRRACARATCDP